MEEFPSKLNLQFPSNKISIKSSSLTFKIFCQSFQQYLREFYEY